MGRAQGGFAASSVPSQAGTGVAVSPSGGVGAVQFNGTSAVASPVPGRATGAHSVAIVARWH